MKYRGFATVTEPYNAIRKIKACFLKEGEKILIYIVYELSPNEL